MKILRNQVKCKHCGWHMRSYADISESFYDESKCQPRCQCGKVSIGGGRRELLRFADEKDYVEESIIEVEIDRKKV